MSRIAFVQSNTAQAGALGNAIETVVAISPPISGPGPDFTVLLFWYVCLNTLGTGTTGVIVRLRRGTTVSGNLINVGAAHTMAAGQGFAVGGSYFDTVSLQAGVQYAVTAQQQGASTNCNVSDVSILAMVL